MTSVCYIHLTPTTTFTSMDSTSGGRHFKVSGSLPSDYAFVSQYTQHNDIPVTEDNDSNLKSSESNDYVGPSSPINNDGLSLQKTLVSETTPLLTSVPQVAEPVIDHGAFSEESYIRMIREELPILSRYAFPVFGQAISILPCHLF